MSTNQQNLTIGSIKIKSDYRVVKISLTTGLGSYPGCFDGDGEEGGGGARGGRGRGRGAAKNLNSPAALKSLPSRPPVRPEPQ